jgi:hypothetical protein
MNRVLIAAIVFLFSCQPSQNRLFEDVNKIAEFDGMDEPTLIQYGKEKGFWEPLMTYGIFKLDSLDFKNYQESIMNNKKFKSGSYYLNIELDDYILSNKLEILNIENSMITENEYDKTYHVYLLSDRNTVAICKVNH